MGTARLCRALLLIVCLSVLSVGLPAPGAGAAEECVSFPQTGFNLCGEFLTYWQNNGGLPVYGYPITTAQNEVNPDNGQTYLTQWFERNRFEYHPEFAGTENAVLLGRLGIDLRRDAGGTDPDFQRAARLYNPDYGDDQQQYFEQTGHNLRFGFLSYWQQNGNVRLFGYPVSEEYLEYDEVSQRSYIVQWFERARFEYHPENTDPQYQVLLGQFGRQILKQRR